MFAPGSASTICNVFRDLCEALRAGMSVAASAEELKFSDKRCRRIVKRVGDALEAPLQNKFSTETEHTRLRWELFHNKVSQLLEDLETAVQESKRGPNRLVVQGTEFTIQWLLPRLLKRSTFLTRSHGSTSRPLEPASHD